MKRHISLSGIGLGLYLIGLGLCYIFQQTQGLQIIGFWLRLYPFLIILLGLDFILTNTNRTPSLFAKPSPLVVTLLILFTIVGAIGNFCFRNFEFDMPRFGHFNHFDKGFFDWEQGPQFEVNQDFTLPPAIKTVKILNQSGDIRINSIPGNTISAKAQIKQRSHHRFLSENQFKLTGDIQGDTFLIRLDYPRRLGGFHHNFNSDIIMSIPDRLSAAIENSAGNVEVTAIAGDLNVETKAGDIRINHVGRDLKLSTMFGNVTIDNITGNAEISTKAGEINIKKIKGHAHIDSISGDVTVSECGAPVDIELKSGNLDLNLAKISDHCELDLKSGNIRLGIPSTARFTIDAQSLSGNIDSDFETMVERKFARTTVRGNVNGGGPLVKIRNVSGNINLETIHY